MPRFLFWNICGNPVQALVGKLATQSAADIVLLAEAPTEMITQQLIELNRSDAGFRYHQPRIVDPAPPAQIFSRLPPDAIQTVRDELGRLSISRINAPIGNEFLLVSVHLPSKLHANREEQAQLCCRWAAIIRETELAAGHERTIVVGDFNMNPFEDGMVSGEGFHAISSRQITKDATARKVSGVRRPYFFNPLWARLGGNGEIPPGTYFKRTGVISHFWHAFDQLLVRPALLSAFNDCEFQIVTQIGPSSLLTRRGRPDANNASDHLPIVFNIDLLQEI